ncbi:HBS1-like protein isoform X3 [Olea europaea var. sylvestris]|uniref:HBS1-like protein isoform X3 n=1 Tax=Olea europaea var. sylvestris TaxID=158386 RepID=UPI000C1CF116|nr:HBS1-like protein isoform X3 [Olea europaea var. sylvestris]
MPLKVNYGVDYNDDYNVYEDDNYHYDDLYEYENEKRDITHQTKAKQEVIRTGAWRCPICTYDNEDSMSECDICGALRNCLVRISQTGDSTAGGGRCKSSGASVMAKSLFASFRHRAPAKSVAFEAKNDAVLIEDAFIIRRNFQEFLRAFSSQKHQNINIAAPFKFDSPSPDDLVSTRLHSSKLDSKANFKRLSSLDMSTREREKNILIESELGTEGPNSSSASVARDGGVKERDFASDCGIKPEILVSRMRSVSLSSKSRTGNVNEETGTSNLEYKPEAWMIPDQAEDRLSQLNLAIVGHVDSGKSTLSGRLLHLLGRISQKEMHRHEKEAKQQGKGSFAYAWALDESAEERERGITMTVAVAFFNSRKYHVVLLDSPGHRDFVPNMISGATQADAAILVVDASMGSFEAGLDPIGGQTREHALLIRSFGVDQIIVVVNKMDVVEYSQERFEMVKQKLGTFLRSCGFKDSSVLWVPASSMENQNLVATPDERLFSWFHGPCLLDAIDSLQLPARDYSKPLLMPICDIIKSQSQGQVSTCGKLVTGAIRTGSKVLIMPSREVATIRSLERDSQACKIARSGDNVTVNLQGIENNHVTAGGVLCHPDFPVRVSNHLELKILVLDIKIPILSGSQLELHIHHAKEAATVVKILSLLDPKTGKVTKKSPRCILAKQNAVVEVVLQGSVCVEEYAKSRALGRVSLRSSGRTVALGLVTQIMKTQ